MPSATGVYNATRTISSDSIDDIPTNNVLDDISFEVTDFIYARDNGTPDGLADPGQNSSEFETGTYLTFLQMVILELLMFAFIILLKLVLNILLNYGFMMQ